MLKLLPFVMVLALGSCSSDSLRSGGVGGRGGNAGSSGNTGGTAGGTGGTNPCPEGETLCSVCGYTQCAGVCSTVNCAGGTSGAGGLIRSGGAIGSDGATGGSGGSGGATGGGTGGATSSHDAGLDGRVDGETDVKSADGFLAADAAASSCDNPLPLRCGDRLNHSTLVQGRANVWSMYGCTQRWMSGREAIYVIQPPTACQVSVQLKNLAADLDILRLQSCDFMSCTSLPVSPITFATGAGQPKFLAVDGYNGAAGSYTLEVDCTCNQDGGTIDAPSADAPGDTAVRPRRGRNSHVRVRHRGRGGSADAQCHIARRPGNRRQLECEGEGVRIRGL